MYNKWPKRMMPPKTSDTGGGVLLGQSGASNASCCCFASSFSVLRFPIGRDFIFPKFSLIGSILFYPFLLIFSLQSEMRGTKPQKRAAKSEEPAAAGSSRAREARLEKILFGINNRNFPIGSRFLEKNIHYY
jgi:hypothetical protein